jgi:ABC-type nitrate/sulfonate/bicarbonate transport system permease component
MAVLQQSRTEALGYAFDYQRGEMTLASASDATGHVAEKPKLLGSILLGIAIGAVAGILVGGLMGIHESASGGIQVTGTSVAQQTAP